MRTQEYELHVQPFCIGDEKSQATKPLEEAAEAFAEWQLCTSGSKADRLSHTRFDVIYECCDTIQAACNLMARVNASSDEVSAAMGSVHESNKRRGRYGQQTDENDFCSCAEPKEGKSDD